MLQLEHQIYKNYVYDKIVPLLILSKINILILNFSAGPSNSNTFVINHVLKLTCFVTHLRLHFKLGMFYEITNLSISNGYKYNSYHILIFWDVSSLWVFFFDIPSCLQGFYLYHKTYSWYSLSVFTIFVSSMKYFFVSM